ncbi:hypothetical protein Ddye_015971 [Dipteronia dyeriana]|uniref:Uncharacterized protein n=1 Tax=Dipteronia dyeriana TaxID=168575 RepID=A0AAD9WZT5_9ROSI|nr:hypothetical protein Ddye_015971 [Dipteronia dyeriana]
MIKRKIMNILAGLELHEVSFSVVEHKRIVHYSYKVQEIDRKWRIEITNVVVLVDAGSIGIPLHTGNILFINRIAVDMAKHCLLAVPTKMISIIFRKMYELKQSVEFVPELDLLGFETLSYHGDMKRQPFRKDGRIEAKEPPKRLRLG